MGLTGLGISTQWIVMNLDLPSPVGVMFSKFRGGECSDPVSCSGYPSQSDQDRKNVQQPMQIIASQSNVRTFVSMELVCFIVLYSQTKEHTLETSLQPELGLYNVFPLVPYCLLIHKQCVGKKLVNLFTTKLSFCRKNHHRKKMTFC